MAGISIGGSQASNGAPDLQGGGGGQNQIVEMILSLLQQLLGVGQCGRKSSGGDGKHGEVAQQCPFHQQSSKNEPGQRYDEGSQTTPEGAGVGNTSVGGPGNDVIIFVNS